MFICVRVSYLTLELEKLILIILSNNYVIDNISHHFLLPKTGG